MVPAPNKLTLTPAGTGILAVTQQYATGSGTAVPLSHRKLPPVKQMRCEDLRKRLIKLLQQELTLVFLVRKLRIYI
ncbi:hypothetical protein DO628_24895 [Salmonella enterica subsp. salamae]|nr:hypothetical protein [Salmonella enterica subsp. salamae serovar Sofia]EBS4543388.1 hypothetical protein [Salmonella enterica subsp. salamae serovar Sofia]